MKKKQEKKAKRSGPLLSFPRLDGRRSLPLLLAVRVEVDNAMSGLEKACSRGCDYCCRNGMQVLLAPHEADQIADRVRDDPAFAIVRERVQSTAQRTRGMTNGQYWEAKVVCPFVENGLCSIYEVRPLACRTWTSVDVDACRASYEQPHVDGQGPGVPAAGIERKDGHVISAAQMAASLLVKHGLVDFAQPDLIQAVAGRLASPIDPATRPPTEPRLI
jgi:Fe-S-cluster containining protein